MTHPITTYLKTRQTSKDGIISINALEKKIGCYQGMIAKTLAEDNPRNLPRSIFFNLSIIINDNRRTKTKNTGY